MIIKGNGLLLKSYLQQFWFHSFAFFSLWHSLYSSLTCPVSLNISGYCQSSVHMPLINRYISCVSCLLLHNKLLPKFSGLTVHIYYSAEYLWVTIQELDDFSTWRPHEAAVKMLAIQQSSEGMSGAGGSTYKMAHTVVGRTLYIPHCSW